MFLVFPTNPFLTRNLVSLFFFFNDPPPTEISPFPLPDAFPIYIRHFAATPVGMRVRAEVEVVKVDGRSVTFRVSVADEKEPIGDGTHERMVVNVARFDVRVQDRKSTRLNSSHLGISYAVFCLKK